MISVTRTRRPRLTLTVDGADYDIRVHAWGRYDLEKLGAEHPYHVHDFECDCPASKFGGGRCKHVLALIDIGLLPEPPFREDSPASDASL